MPKANGKIKNEDLCFVLEKIKTAYDNSPAFEMVEMDLTPDSNGMVEGILSDKFNNAIKLLRESGAIKDDLEYNSKVDIYDKTLFYFRLTPKFSELYNKCNEYKKEKVYWIGYRGRCVFLNGKYIINEMQFDRYTEHWFEYIFKNPEKNITLQEIVKKTKKKSETKKDNLHKFLNQINFKGQLRKLFFDCSKSRLKFYKTITEGGLEERLIDIKELEKEIKKLKKLS